MSEPLTDSEWREWLANASDDELRGQAETWSRTRTGMDAQDELDRRDAASLQADADTQLAEDIREHEAERLQGLHPIHTQPRMLADYEVRRAR